MRIKISSIYVNDQEKAKPLGANFTMPPTKVNGLTMAMLKDTCGNLAQIVALEKLAG